MLHARDLAARPRAVFLHGRELVLFRTASGLVGALGNTCPHRRARLSDGWVDGDAVVCPYHGFRYDCAGTGASPGTPQMHLSAERFDAREAFDAIWVRAHDGVERALPLLGKEGYTHVGTLVHDVDCPLEPLVDNFCEVEHTPTTHTLFGYRADALGSIDVEVHTAPDEVRVVNVGPQKYIPGLVERAFKVKTGDDFIDDWTVRFSPVHILYDQWWRDAGTHVPRPDRIHVGVFFTPLDRDDTRLVTILFSNRKPSLLDPLLRPLLRALVDREVRCDRRRVEALADKRAELRGTRLGRFDAALREHRKRIDTIYRGHAARVQAKRGDPA